MTRTILIILHAETSTPGRIGQQLMAKGCRLDIRRHSLGEPLPETMDHHHGAMIFGGPMSANDNDPWIASEIDWIAKPLALGKPFLGICLGAQMLAKQLGGSVGPHADGHTEIGYYPIRPTEPGRAYGPWPSQVYQWHRESFTLPTTAERLATSDTFENQAYRYGASAFGIQFHPEVTRLTMHRWTVKGAHRFVLPGAQGASTHLAGNLIYDDQMKTWISRFLDRWLLCGASEAPG